MLNVGQQKKRELDLVLLANQEPLEAHQAALLKSAAREVLIHRTHLERAEFPPWLAPSAVPLEEPLGVPWAEQQAEHQTWGVPSEEPMVELKCCKDNRTEFHCRKGDAADSR